MSHYGAKKLNLVAGLVIITAIFLSGIYFNFNLANNKDGRKQLAINIPEAQAAAATCIAKVDLVMAIDSTSGGPSELEVCNALVDVVNDLNEDPLLDINGAVVAVGERPKGLGAPSDLHYCMADSLGYTTGKNAKIGTKGLNDTGDDFAYALYDTAKRSLHNEPFSLKTLVLKANPKILAKRSQSPADLPQILEPDTIIVDRTFWREGAVRVIATHADECPDDGTDVDGMFIGGCIWTPPYLAGVAPNSLLATDRTYYLLKSLLDTPHEIMSIILTKNEVQSPKKDETLSYTETADENGNGVMHETISFDVKFATTDKFTAPLALAKRMMDIDGAGLNPSVGTAQVFTGAADLADQIKAFALKAVVKALDRDEDGHISTVCAATCPHGKKCDDHYDTEDDTPPGTTPEQRKDTLNDLDLDGFPRNDAVGVACTPLTCEPVANDKNGCVNPGSYEGICPPGVTCVTAAKDTATGRIPHNIFNLSPPGPVLPHPWDVCTIEAYYGCGPTLAVYTGIPPPDPHPIYGPLLKKKVQCSDLADNNLNTLTDSAELNCQEIDVDGDFVVSATHNACFSQPTCDFYDNPSDFGVSGCDVEPSTGKKWLQIFKETTDNDLDKDGQSVAFGRVLGSREEEQKFVRDPENIWKDWYDNPFTAELKPLAVRPMLSQLKNTLGDLDLDSFAAQSWQRFFDINTKTEPDNSDVAIVTGKNRAGCAFPGALEETCSDCTAYVPDWGTGRVPPAKASPSFNPKDVCQIEAFYEKEGMKKVFPGSADISASQQPPSFNGNPLLSATAQCGDEVDNDIDGLKDGAEPTCPKAGGLAVCGRYSDDPTTPADESAPCGFCHFFYLFDKAMNWIIWRIMPALALALIVLAGFTLIISRGNPAQASSGKNILVYTVAGYALVLISWVVLNSLFSGIGVKKWTGLAGESGEFEGGGSCTEFTDLDKAWAPNEWAGLSVTLKHPELAPKTAIIKSNNNQMLTLETCVNTEGKGLNTFSYTIGGWWQFSCGI